MRSDDGSQSPAAFQAGAGLISQERVSPVAAYATATSIGNDPGWGSDEASKSIAAMAAGRRRRLSLVARIGTPQRGSFNESSLAERQLWRSG